MILTLSKAEGEMEVEIDTGYEEWVRMMAAAILTVSRKEMRDPKEIHAVIGVVLDCAVEMEKNK